VTLASRPDAYLSEHFQLCEFACHDGATTPPDAVANLVRLCQMALEGVRADWGGSIIVVSGYRSPAHNTAVGGAPHSQHVLGTAADIRPVDMSRMEEFVACCERAVDRYPAIGGIGVYGLWVHLDVRERAGGHVARWTGAKQGDEPA
jgi:uncharacterized protein YcbK (DUF882 family)